MKISSGGLRKVDFDQFSHNYREALRSCTGLLGKSDDFFASVKLHCLKNWVLTDDGSCEILDFGCGIGALSGFLAKDFPNSQIYGYDISQKCLSVAKENNAGVKNVRFASDLPQGKKYDLIIAANVFHHIKPPERVGALCFLKELLKPKGKIIIFEHNPFNPLTRSIVRSCPFDSDATLIWRREFCGLTKTSGLEIVNNYYILFFPWASKIFRKLENLLKAMPLGGQYMLLLEVIPKPSEGR